MRMWTHGIVAKSAVLGLALSVGCATASVRRVGDFVALPSGTPKTPCEESQWLRAAPTRAESRASESLGDSTYRHRETQEGLGIYDWGEERPIDTLVLGKRLPIFSRDPSTRSRLEDTESDLLLYNTLFYGGGGISVAGALGGIAISDNEDALPVMIGLALGGLVMMFASGSFRPSAEERNFYHTHRYLYTLGPDRLTASVDIQNGKTRRRCQGGVD
ncbi:MAG: hypothetical protein AAFY60_04835 [Myxococcota bacterium]